MIKTKEKNECGKMRDQNNPYEVWQGGGWTWRVLKKYQKPSLEAENPYARWFCAVCSPFSYGEFELGDVYVKEIKGFASKVS